MIKSYLRLGFFFAGLSICSLVASLGLSDQDTPASKGKIAYVASEYTSERGFDRDIFIYDTYEDSTTRIVNGLQENMLTIMPDGGSIIFSAVDRLAGREDSDIYIMGRDGSNLLAIADTETDEDFPSLSPGGRFLAYHEGAYERPQVLESLVIRDMETGLSQRFSYSGVEFLTSPIWSPDSGRLLLRGIDANSLPRILTIDYDGSDMRDITPQNYNPIYAAWSSDSQNIFFSGWMDIANPNPQTGFFHISGIWSMRYDGQDVRLLRRGLGMEELETTSGRIPFSYFERVNDSSDISRSSGLHIVDYSTGIDMALLGYDDFDPEMMPYSVECLRFSPDNSYLAFFAKLIGENYRTGDGAYMLNLRTFELSRISSPSLGYIFDIEWLPEVSE